VSKLFRVREECVRRAHQNNSQTQGRTSRFMNTLEEILRKSKRSTELLKTLSDSSMRALSKCERAQDQHFKVLDTSKKLP
jgi:hypothetical protein